MKKYILLATLSVMSLTEAYADANITSKIGWYREMGPAWYQGKVNLKNTETGAETILHPAQTNQADDPVAGTSTLPAGEYEITAGYYDSQGKRSKDYPDASCRLANNISLEDGKSYEIDYYFLNDQDHCEVRLPITPNLPPIKRLH